MEYYYSDVASNQPRGPITLEQLQAMASSGQLPKGTLVCPVGGQAWLEISSVVAHVPPPLAYVAPLAGSRSNETDPTAIASLVCGLIGFCCGCLTAIPAVVCGHIALANIKRNPSLQGKEMAIAGLIIGYLVILVGILYIIFVGGVVLIEGLAGGK